MWLGLIPLLLFQRTVAVDPRVPDKAKQAQNLIAQIQRLAASEPGAYGIDTRLLLVDAVHLKYPAVAKDMLRDSVGALSGVKDPARQNGLRVRIVERLAPFDLTEAEELARTLARVNGEDYPGTAYDSLCAFLEGHREEQRRMLTRGLAAGAFRMQHAVGELKHEIDSGSSSAQALFSEILSAFPASAPAEEDVFLLIDLAGDIRPVSQPLTLQAIDKALDAATSEKLQLKIDPDDKSRKPRQEMLARISKLIGSMDPEVAQRYRERLQELHDEMPAQSPKTSELSGMGLGGKPDDAPYADALESARKQDDLSRRVEALIDLSRREDITPQQRASVASEAVSAALKLPIGGDRLVALAMLSRDFARRNELESAAQAAQYLSDSYGKVCDCPDGYCEHNHEPFDCIDLVESFAEYLDEFKISSEAMALNNISLQSRLLVLKLKELLK